MRVSLKSPASSEAAASEMIDESALARVFIACVCGPRARSAAIVPRRRPMAMSSNCDGCVALRRAGRPLILSRSSCRPLLQLIAPTTGQRHGRSARHAEELFMPGQRGQVDLLPHAAVGVAPARPANAGRAGARRRRSALSCSALRRPASRSTSSAQFTPRRGVERQQPGLLAPRLAAQRARRPRKAARSTTPCSPPRRLATPTNHGCVCGTGSSGADGEDLAGARQRQQQALARAFDRQPGAAPALRCARPAAASASRPCSSRSASRLAMSARAFSRRP